MSAQHTPGRKVNESARIVVRTACGNRLEVNGKGDAAESLFTAFYCLDDERRTVLLARMQKVHADMLAKATGSAS